MTDRSAESEIDVRSTPEDAFAALVEPERLRAWVLDDAWSDLQVGGTYRWTWSISLGDVTEGTYLEIGRPRSLVTESTDRDAPGPITTAYAFEDLGGGRTRIRVVNSGFGSSAEWDAAFERWREGAMLFLKELKRYLEDGFDRRRMPRLGVAFGPGDRGRRVEAVVGDGPAERAGLLPGDVITRLNGEEVDGYAEIARFLVNQRPGTVISVTVQRGEAALRTDVLLTPPL